MDGFNDVGDVVSILRSAPCLGIADVVEVDAVDVVFLGNLAADVSQIAGREGGLRVHISLVANLSDERPIASAQLLAAVGVPLAHRNGDHPGVKLHATAVTLVDGKLQGIVAGRQAGAPRETTVPRLQVGRIDGGGTHTRLQQHGVDAHSLQAVQHLGELLLLCLDAHVMMGVCRRPVDASDGGQPYGSYLVFGLCMAQNGCQEQEKKYNSLHFGCKGTKIIRNS